MKKQELYGLPEKFALYFFPFCGTPHTILDDVGYTYAQCREKVAEILHRKRRDPETDWEISVVEPNLAWEVVDDGDAGYRSGIYRISPPEIMGNCETCGSIICTSDSFYRGYLDEGSICCSETCYIAALAMQNDD